MDGGMVAVERKTSQNSLSSRQTLDRCGFCSAKEPLEPCASCRTVAYCSQEHQRFDWKRHKPICKMMSSRQDPAVPPRSTAEIPPAQSSVIEQSPFGSGFRPYVKPQPAAHGIAGTSALSQLASTGSLTAPQLNGIRQSIDMAMSAAHLTQPPPQQPAANPLMPFVFPASLPIGKLPQPPTVPLGNLPQSAAPPMGNLPQSAPIGEIGRIQKEVTSRTSSPVNRTSIPESSSSGDLKSSSSQDRLVETDDPDIQIIENSSTARSTRKRPTPTGSTTGTVEGAPKQFKDHSANMSYNVTPEEHNRYLMEQGRAFNRHQSGELRLSFIAEHILKSLTDYGWAVIDNFLGNDHCTHVNKEIQVLESRGLFTAGQVVDGKSKDEQHVKDIRSDKTYWFSGSDSRSSDACTVRMLVTYLDGIVNRFSRRLPGNTIQGRSKAMLAIYPGNGSRYVKHVDNPAKDGRRITVIYYCNPGWDHKKDGGVLRLYPETSSVPLDIEPKADRLLIFWSDHRIPHEVMPVFKDRYAITVWYMDRNERDEHIKKSDARSSPSANGTAATATATVTEKGPLEDLSPKSPKEQKLESSPPTLRHINIQSDVGEADSADSGRGASLIDKFGSQQSLSFQSHRTTETKDSDTISDDDERSIPAAPEPDPEYEI